MTVILRKARKGDWRRAEPFPKEKAGESKVRLAMPVVMSLRMETLKGHRMDVQPGPSG